VPVDVGDGGEVLDQSLHELARILFTGSNPEGTLETVARLAQRSIPQCEAASVTIVEDGKPRTTVSTAELALAIDRHQYAQDEGPCLEAIRTQRVIRVDSFGAEVRWPAFVPAVKEHGVQSSLSLPLMAADVTVGALNMYSLLDAGFAAAEDIGQIFAAEAAITLANAAAYYRATELARNLTLALEHRDVIGQAKGILMAQEGLTSEAAFDVLRRASQRSNRKVYELAAEIVARNAGRRSDPEDL
jgi:GAF domain-containing protein